MYKQIWRCLIFQILFNLLCCSVRSNKRVKSNLWNEKQLRFSQLLKESAEGDGEEWANRLLLKSTCLRKNKLALYFNHMRKTAGTSLRDILIANAVAYKYPLYETEGRNIPVEFMQLPGLFSFISLRNPIERIVSLYWYEHVAWYDGVVKKPEKLVTFNKWVSSWRDGSQWKNRFSSKFPRNNYVEIENYYVKSLIGYDFNRNRPICDEDLTLAKNVLKSYDIVVITEWMNNKTHLEFINDALSGNVGVHNKNSLNTKMGVHKVKGDYSARIRLAPKLMPNDGTVELNILREINKYDLQLYDFAMKLVNSRMHALKSISRKSLISSTEVICDNGNIEHVKPKYKYTANGMNSEHHPKISSNMMMSKLLKSYIGLFQPPGHKGPF